MENGLVWKRSAGSNPARGAMSVAQLILNFGAGMAIGWFFGFLRVWKYKLFLIALSIMMLMALVPWLLSGTYHFGQDASLNVIVYFVFVVGVIFGEVAGSMAAGEVVNE